MQDAYNELSQHRCDANAFEIAYWQEHQKLDEALRVNKALGLQLEGAQSTIDHYEQKLIPDSLRAQKDAEQHAISLASKLELREPRLKRDRSSGLSNAKNSVESEKVDETHQNEQLAADGLGGSPRGPLETQRGRVNDEAVTRRANRAKLRRLAGAALSESS